MKKYLNGMVAILPPLAAFAVQLISVSILSMIFSGISAVLTKEINYLLSALAVMCSGIVFAFWYRHEICGEIRGKLKHLVNVKNMIKFICLALGCQLFVSGLLSILTDYFPKAFDKYGDTIGSILSGSPIVVVIVTVIIAPITEELIFRGVTLHVANRQMPFLLANVLQAVLFGVYHGNLIQGIYAAGLGFILGLIYQKFRTIYAPIILHMMVNASAFFVMFISETKLSYVTILVIGFILAFAGFIRLKPVTDPLFQKIHIISENEDKNIRK